MKTKQRKSSLQSRLFAYFLMLIIPIQIAAIVMISWNNTLLRKELEQRASATVSYLSQTLDTRLTAIQSQLNLLLNGNDLTLRSFALQSSTMETQDFYLASRKIRQQLWSTCTANDLLSEVQVHFPYLGRSVSSKHSILFTDQAPVLEQVQQYYTQQAAVVSAANQLFVGNVFPWAGSYEKPHVFLQAVISPQAILDLISAFDHSDQQLTVFVHHESGHILSSSRKLTSSLLEEAGLLEMPAESPNNFSVSIDGEPYSGFGSTLPSFGVSVMQLIPVRTLTALNSRVEQLLAFYILLSVPLLFLFAFIINRLVTKPFRHLINAFHQLETGNMDCLMEETSSAHEFQSVISGFNTMTMQLKALIDKLYKQELLHKQIELKQLQTQINPHFLFNNLFILKRMIQAEENHSAAELAEYLGEYYEYITRTGTSSIPLTEEYHHVHNYAQMQLIRFGNRLTIDLQPLPEEARALMVPKLILQPLVENSLLHGVENHAAGLIQIRFETQGRMLAVIVEDNGSGISQQKIDKLQIQLDHSVSLQETTALINIHRRLQLAFHGQASLRLSQSDLGGLKVTLLLPLNPS